MGTGHQPKLMTQSLFHIVITLLLTLCILSVAEGQHFAGHYGLQRPETQITHTSLARLPVRVLLSEATFGHSTIGTAYTNGDLRTLQQPKTSVHTRLESYGLTTFRNLRLEGTFTFIQEQEKDIGWKLVRDVGHQPYYYANIRPGDWNNDRYRVQVNGGSRLFSDRVLLAFGTDYQVERLARYNDPRPLINYHNLFLKAQIGFETGAHIVALYAGTGDANETGIVRNYNTSNDSFGRTEYNLITVTGLGSFSLLRRSQYEHPLNASEIGLTWVMRGSTWVSGTEIIYRNQESTFSRRGSSGSGVIFEPMGTYYLQAISADVYWSADWRGATIQLLSHTRISDGYDFNTQVGGANYFHETRLQQLQLYYHHPQERLSAMLKTQFKHDSVTDRNASHHYGVQSLGGLAALQLSRSYGNWRATLIPGAGYTMVLGSTLRIPENRVNLHSTNVLYPLYALETSDAWVLNGGLHVQRFLRDYSVALLFEYSSRFRATRGIRFENAAFQPEHNRNHVQLTLQFFH